LGFKIIGRAKTEPLSFKFAELYYQFINSLPLGASLKEKIILDVKKNWMCDEWRISFIDAGRIIFEKSGGIPWTTNNFTERIHRTIEAVQSGKQTVLTFIERLYGYKFQRNSLTNQSGQNEFEAGLVTLFNTQSIEQVNYFIIFMSFNLLMLLLLIKIHFLGIKL
jgi:hypothetical protein